MESVLESISTMGAGWLTQWVVTAIARIIIAVIVFFVGYIIALICEGIAKRILMQLKIDHWIKERGLEKALFNISMTKAVAWVVKWYVIVIALREALVQLNLVTLASFFGAIIDAVPNWILGAIMLGIGLILAHFASEKIKEKKFALSDFVSGVVYFIIVYFAIVLALPKFGYTEISLLADIFRYFIAGISAGIAIALGISFGFALQEPAKRWLKKYKI
ncbi:MAG: hypothetical protein OH319_00750 [Candidatus Parvarchaeota archaeon]|nr:hypothetical protein [Candidatus Jingweiarchaeum tengchongense]MCW1297893.1 hypothetical protein [Candidatus Jingweiarchaeum tengchongense]MCW1299904.1 hypothetical protein [Candidatus Jingweiarchaeum tengchongense]MCW1305092.1 hypothetical protein [Candidatus Jingweiarchaeum tengchongense]MCW1305154.1 hypothetical protein [Candidatus Jingweiarchaeum tengchongense]